MKTAVYDSPRTCCREAWRDGKLVASITESLMYSKGFNGWPDMPFMLNCGRKFEPGKVRGDIEAIPEDQRPPPSPPRAGFFTPIAQQISNSAHPTRLEHPPRAPGHAPATTAPDNPR